MLNNNLYLNRRAQHLVATENKETVINSLEKDDQDTEVTKKNLQKDSSDKNIETSEKYIENKKVSNAFSNQEKTTEKNVIPTINQSSTSMNYKTIENYTLDVYNFLNNSEIQTIKDDEKKKKIEDIIKEDLNKLFPTTTNSTDGYTDMFKELEDAFDLS